MINGWIVRFYAKIQDIILLILSINLMSDFVVLTTC